MAQRADLVQQVQKALAMHNNWKAQLASSMSTGASGFDPDKARQDTLCPLGAWLAGPMDPALKKGIHFEKVKKLHAEFHAAAGRVVRLAHLGLTGDAREAMEPDSSYAQSSMQLTMAMVAWRATFEK
jgi:hypothetical protein